MKKYYFECGISRGIYCGSSEKAAFLGFLKREKPKALGLLVRVIDLNSDVKTAYYMSTEKLLGRRFEK